ncbi:ATP-dependent DNA helicase PIF1 [Gammaproteobacteria bacterium]
MNKPSIIFLTGNAGTGKTTFLKHIMGKSDAPIDEDNIYFIEAVNSVEDGNKIVVAPTGVAAINAGGVTINSFFQINPYKKYSPKMGYREVFAEFKYKTEKKAIIKEMDVLIIDEISMVKCEMLDLLDNILKTFRGNYSLPFGGVQLVVIGDLFQLPPIKSKPQDLNLEYKTEYFFSAKIFHECLFSDKVKFIELKKIYRQKNDEFISILNNVRDGSILDSQLKSLNDRTKLPESDTEFITITTHNANANEINKIKYDAIDSEEFNFKATMSGEFKDDFFKQIELVSLKVGAQVMVIKNNNSRGYYNGMIGNITEINENNVVINVKGKSVKVFIEKWEKFEAQLSKSIGGESKIQMVPTASFEQMPLKLAWAITVHKSQGLTFDNVIADVDASFDSGQVYVALSRCTSLEGLYLKNSIPMGAIKVDRDVVSFTKYIKAMNDKLKVVA